MYAGAEALLDYVPIRRSPPEDNYINHLWATLVTLDGTDELVRPFGMMPLHLLFMLALQYKVLRVAAVYPPAMELFFASVGGRDKQTLLRTERSVFDIALINERTIPEALRLVGLEPPQIKQIKELVDRRNNELAHARGGIEPNIDNRVQEYVGVFVNIQTCFTEANQILAQEWVAELQEGDDIDLYFGSRFLDSGLCPADFGDMVTILLSAEHINEEQWQQILNKSLGLAYDQTNITLRSIANEHPSPTLRLRVIRELVFNGQLDDDAIARLLEKETDADVREFLATLTAPELALELAHEQ